MSGLDSMPEGLAPYKRTPSFSEATVPSALTADHSTKEGVWGLIHVEAGEMDYIVPSEGRVHKLSAGETCVIRSALLHKVRLGKGAEFFVEFWR